MMKSRIALAIALGVSAAALTAVNPAVAAKKEKAPTIQLSDAIRKELGPAQEAMKANDFAKAQGHVDAARAAATTEDEKFIVGQIQLNIGIMAQDNAKVCLGVDEMLATSKTSAEDKPKLASQQGHCAYEAKNYPKAEQAYAAAIASGPVAQDVYARLADAQFRDGKTVEAVATLQKVIADEAAAGKSVPSDWYARGADMASRAKAAPQFVDISSAWLAAYPVKQNWHDSVMIYRQMSNPSGDADLDLLRLLRASGAMPLAAASAYTDYAIAVYLKYPNEAVTVLKEGIAAGKLNPTSSQNTREILAISEPKIAADRTAVKGAVAASQGAKATYQSVLSNADLSYGFGEYKQAADLYALAATKPGANADIVNLRAGASLIQSGDKEGGKAALAKVQGGTQKVVARYWTVLADHPAAS
ncbi:hypothetical protein [Sphingomonas crocodyli]|uniref:Uncharacterized protein n=1 Tax=Sphingomonas crocodyli TaxID=1979270 RepID=A0A437M9G9_9SPHN|nr:hypothetical protein [Sphingomonas crocodyli]RVT94351.1 hypothetical protein EOD43_11055 [Sphingomonas crocodyli]